MPPPLTVIPSRRANAGQPRAAAVQPMTLPPSSAMRPAPRTGAYDEQFLASYQDWQDWIRRYSRTSGLVRFALGLKADACARCLLRIEERDPTTGEWGETDQQALGPWVFDAYRNPMENTSELVRSHAWHYSGVGECALVMTDGRDGTDYGIYSMRAIERDKPSRGETRVMLVPNGKETDGTAFVVPSEQVVRMWIPDEEWKGLATSPLAAAVEPLRRYESLARTVRRAADSRLIQNGLVWTPSKAHERMIDPETGDLLAESRLQHDFYEAAKRAYRDDDDILSVAPFLVWWGEQGDAPQKVDLGSILDPEGAPLRREALEDAARPLDLPSSIVVTGGGGEANHWSEWLMQDKTFDSAIAPTMNRITHGDMTETFLPWLLKFHRLPPDRFRVGYDPGPVIIRPDQSEIALKLHLAGLLSSEATLEAANFSLDQIMQPDELGRLLEVLSKGQAGAAAPVLPAGPSNVTQAPPVQSPDGAPIAVRTSAAQIEAPPEDRVNVSGVLARLAALRQELGRRLLAAAEVAFASAIRHAGTKIQVRARRSNAQVREQVRVAVAEGQPLGALIAAVGITEEELLRDQFDDFAAQAQTWTRQTIARQRRLLADAGLDPDIVPDDRDAQAAAAAAMGAGLIALARQRLTEGPFAPPPGEISGQVPAALIIRPLDVATGRATVQGSSSPDVPPTIVLRADVVGVEREVAEGLDAPLAWTWVHGFYGEPVTVFEPHEDLGISEFTTTDRDNDPALESTVDWIDGLFQPGDHDGCTCEWVPAEAPRPETPVQIPGPGSEAVDVALGRGERTGPNVIRPTGDPDRPFGR